MDPELLREVLRQIVQEEIVRALHEFAEQCDAELEALEARIVARLSK